MKRFITAIILAVLALTMAVPASANANGENITEEYTDIMTDFTVVGSTYNDKTKRYDLAISMKEKHFSIAENKELWYYTTSNISVGGDSGIDVSDDGTNKGKEEYDNLFNRNGCVTYGTVVELRWNGMVQETYPPQLCGIREVRFTGKQSNYSREEIDQERSAMNEMFSGDAPHYPDEAADEPVNIPDGNLFQSFPYESIDKNPPTGTDTFFASTALAGILAWVASLISLKHEKSTKNE